MTDKKHTATAIRSPRGARSTSIEWADGHRGVYPHEILRGYCPCAGCQGHSGTISFIDTKALPGGGTALEIEEIAPVGNYALQLTWLDGHSSGIYSYVYLRSLCQCAECAGPHGEPIPR